MDRQLSAIIDLSRRNLIVAANVTMNQVNV